MTEELSQLNLLVRPGSVKGRKDRLYNLEKMIANSMEKEEDWISPMQEKYDMYKKGYLQFLRFNPDKESSQNKPNFSKLHLNLQI